jgi:hypothetical protein
MTTAKKTEPAAELLPLLECGGADERLFIECGCGHRAAFHADHGCKYVKPAVTDKSSYQTKEWAGGPCTCPTPREVVYVGGRVPEKAAA